MKVLKPKTKNTKAREKANRKLPPDTYKPLMAPVEVSIDESRKLFVNVQRGGDDGLPCVDVRTFQTTEAYTGYTKKGINLPLDMLTALIEALQEVSDRAEEDGLYKEYEE